MARKVTTALFLLGVQVFAFVPLALAQETGEAGSGSLVKFGLALGAGIGLAIAALGGALGQGRTAAAALEGIARNPGAADRMFVPMILGLAFIESLVLYVFVIAFMLQGKI